MEIAEKVKEVICEQFAVAPESVKDSTTFVDDLGADSLAMVELVLAMEEAFGVSIPEDAIERIRTVGDAIAYIDELRGRHEVAREAS